MNSEVIQYTRLDRPTTNNNVFPEQVYCIKWTQTTKVSFEVETQQVTY